MNVLTAERIREIAEKRDPIPVDVSKWWGEGATVYVRGMTAEESILWTKLAKEHPDHELMYAVAIAACNDDGSPMFNVETDVPLLLKLNMKALIRLSSAIFKASHFGKDDEEKNP